MEYLLERMAKELEAWERMGDNMTAEIEDLEDRVKELTRVLLLAYRALTEGLADVPAEGRDPKCARLRAEAKREIRRVLGMGEERWEKQV